MLETLSFAVYQPNVVCHMLCLLLNVFFQNESYRLSLIIGYERDSPFLGMQPDHLR
jgi:hypothetical protein